MLDENWVAFLFDLQEICFSICVISTGDADGTCARPARPFSIRPDVEEVRDLAEPQDSPDGSENAPRTYPDSLCSYACHLGTHCLEIQVIRPRPKRPGPSSQIFPMANPELLATGILPLRSTKPVAPQACGILAIGALHMGNEPGLNEVRYGKGTDAADLELLEQDLDLLH
jgi:hypothetical protein